MSKARIKTPSRPDLQSIFNTQQRKPRSVQAKSIRSKLHGSSTVITDHLSTATTRAVQSPAFVSGDLLQLFAAKLENESSSQHEDLPRKRHRVSEDALERHVRHRIDKSQGLSSSLEKINPDSFEDKTAPPKLIGIDVALEKQHSDDSNRVNLSAVPVAAPSSVLNTVRLQSSDEIGSEVARLSANPKRLSRGCLLMKSAVASDRTSLSVGNSESRQLKSESSNSTSHEPEPITSTLSSATSEAQIARIVSWTSEAKRLIAPGLPLPTRLQSLKEVFKAVETTMNVHRARRRMCVLFPELSSGVHSILKKTFTKSSLAQIVHLFPEGYTLQNKAVRDPESGRNENAIAITMVELPESVGLNHLQRSQHRLDKFADCLLRHAFKFYLQWVKQNLPHQLEEIEKLGLYNLDSWPPSFPLERCPAVPLAKLPTPVSKFKAQLANLVEDHRAEDTQITDGFEADRTSDIVDVPKELQGIPLSFIERVRKKEAAAREVSLQIGTREKIQSDLELESLPDFVILVHGIFSALGKPSMLYSALISQLKYKVKHQLVSEESIVSRVNLLLELLPSFCQKIADGRIEAFRIDLGANVAHLRAELRHAIRQRRAKESITKTLLK